jgi:hypothetical protein
VDGSTDWAEAFAGQATTPQHVKPKHKVIVMTERVNPFLPEQMDRMSEFFRIEDLLTSTRTYNGILQKGAGQIRRKG